jgi:hypothetical protein
MVFITIPEDAIIKGLNHEIPFEEVNAFSTKIGMDVDDVSEALPVEAESVNQYEPVDNFSELEISEAIMDTNEIIDR